MEFRVLSETWAFYVGEQRAKQPITINDFFKFPNVKSGFQSFDSM